MGPADDDEATEKSPGELSRYRRVLQRLIEADNPEPMLEKLVKSVATSGTPCKSGSEHFATAREAKDKGIHDAHEVNRYRLKE